MDIATGIFLCLLVYCVNLVVSDTSCVGSLRLKFDRALQEIEKNHCDHKMVEEMESCLIKGNEISGKCENGCCRNRRFLFMFLNNYHQPNQAYVLIHAHEKGHCNVSSPHTNLRKTVQLKRGQNKIDFGKSLVGPWHQSALENKGILVETSIDVSVHEYLYGYIRSGTLYGIEDAFNIIPVTDLSTSYTISAAIPRLSQNTDSYFGVVASEDDTDITIVLPSGIKYKSIRHGGLLSGPIKKTLKRQQTLQIWTPGSDSSGTSIKSNKPIAVFSASHCYSPSRSRGGNGCSLMMHMMPPIDTLDSEFFIPLSKKTFVRLFAGSSVSNATVYFPQGNSMSYNIKPFQYQDIYDNIKNNPVKITGTNGLLVTHFNSESWWGGNYIRSGNTVVPGIHQYLSTYDFHIYDLGSGNPNFVPYNIIDVIILKSDASNLRLDNNPLSSPVKLVEAFGYMFYTFNIPPGQHTMRHLNGKPFGLFVFQGNGDSGCGFSPGFNLK